MGFTVFKNADYQGLVTTISFLLWKARAEDVTLAKARRPERKKLDSRLRGNDTVLPRLGSDYFGLFSAVVFARHFAACSVLSQAS